MKFRFFLILFAFFQLLKAQNALPQNYFQDPLKIPLVLAGTFAELRSNHFHSGMDIKTQQRTGLGVLASAKGYISRIKISRYGYGKALYIQHPNGYTTVYGHLRNFSPAIEAYVKKRQYSKESYTIQLFPKANELPVEQGHLIAYSGETGGAAGPHLHFEIRDGKQRPMNPLDFGFKINDSRKPTIYSVFVYPRDNQAQVNGSAKRQQLQLIPQADGNFITDPLEAFGKIGFGVRTIDQLDDAPNHNGVYRIKTSINGNKNFEIDFRKFSFSETRYINRLIDYPYYINHHQRIQKLFIKPHNPLSLYKNINHEGYLDIKDSLDYNYKIEVSDFEGNTRIVRIPIKSHYLPHNKITLKETHKTNYLAQAHQASAFDLKGFDVYIPKGALYEDTYLDLKSEGDKIQVHRRDIPLKYNITIGFDVSKFSKADKDKMYIARMSTYGTPYYSTTSKKMNRFTTKTRTFGTYNLVTDDKPPKIEPVNFKDKKWMSNSKILQFKITDEGSGIDDYRATINGKFILMEYEYKDHTLTYHFSDDIIQETENKLKIIVTDNVGNSTTYTGTFYRKK